MKLMEIIFWEDEAFSLQIQIWHPKALPNISDITEIRFCQETRSSSSAEHLLMLFWYSLCSLMDFYTPASYTL